MEKKKSEQQDELTEAMHSEFTIDAETEIKHKCYAALGCVQDGADIAEMLPLYGITRADIERNIDEFNSLQEDGQQITL